MNQLQLSGKYFPRPITLTRLCWMCLGACILPGAPRVSCSATDCNLCAYDNKTFASFTWAGEANSSARWAGVSLWGWATVQESRLIASTLELFGPHWSLPFSIERPLEDWRSPTAELPADHLSILLVKVSLTHWGPGRVRLVRLHLQSTWAQTDPIQQPDRVWRGQKIKLR